MTILTRAAGASLLLAVISISSAPAVHAQRYDREDWQRYWEQYQNYDRDDWRGSGEGDVDEEIQESSVNRRGISSATQRKINDLDDDPVDELPIPILLGVTKANIYSDFGDARDGGDREHEGQDILAPKGAYIVSPTEAVVIRVGSGDSAGKYVYTANPGGETFAYMHLDEIADDLSSGDELKPGDLIGYVGNTGNAVGGVTHLHFEIRDGREPTDPYPRLDREFTTKERMAALERILEDSDDEEEEAEGLVSAHRALFVAARTQGIELPDAITEALGTIPAGASGAVSGSFTRDLTLGSTGADVTALQSILISANSGSAARALAEAGATGYFGPITQRALAEYQGGKGISPAVGYFGPITRGALAP